MANYLAFKHDKLDLQAITDLVTAASCGAISIFVGTTRDNFDGKPVLNLEYEAYESMGLKALERICEQIRKRWSDVENIAIHHRLGQVPIKEASVIIAISSPHREEAIKATEFCINGLKQSVPIWKKEVYMDNQAAWKENKESLISDSVPPKRKRVMFDITQEVQTEYVAPHLVQIKASNAELESRIEKFIERKREEINAHNNREFFTRNRDEEFGCARIDAIVRKRKDSKSHLQVERVLNSYQHREQHSSDYMRKFMPQNGIEERLHLLETQLSLTRAVPKNVYERIKNLENRLLFLESLSPEYVQFWENSSVMSSKSLKKKVFLTVEVDELISAVEKRCAKKS